MSHDVLVWDGKEFDTVPPTKATEMIAKGGHQMATGVCTNKLMTAEQMRANKKAMQPAPAKKKKQTYKTREMKADGADGQSTLPPGVPGV